MVGKFVRERYPLLALATIIVVALALLLIRGVNGIGQLHLGGPGLEHGATGVNSGVAGLSSGSALGETGVPDALGAASGYQIDRSQTGGYMTAPQPTSGETIGARPTSVQPPGGQTTGGETAIGQSTGGQTPGDQQISGGTTGGTATDDRVSGAGGGQDREGVATPELPSAILVVLGLISLLGVGWLNARRRNAFNRT